MRIIIPSIAFTVILLSAIVFGSQTFAQLPLAPSAGGTGVNNGSNTITLNGNLTVNSKYTLDSKQASSPVDHLSGTGMQTEFYLLSGQIDASVPIMDAVAAGPVKLPCGTYRLDGPLSFGSTSQVFIDGSGPGDPNAPGCVTLSVNFTSGDIISASHTNRLRISHIGVDYPGSTPRLSGAVFHLQSTYDAHLEDIVVSGKQFGDAFLVDGANTTRIDKYDCRPPVTSAPGSYGAGACIHGTGGFVDLFFGNGTSANYHYGLELTSGSGAYGDRASFVESGAAIEFDPSYSAAQSVFGVNLTTMYADTSQANNIIFEGDGWITDVQLTAPWSSNSQTAAGIVVNNTRLNGLQLISPTILGNHSYGLAVLAGTRVTVTDVHSFFNSRSGANQADDIYIGSSPSIVSVLGAQVGTGGTFLSYGSTPYSRYGLNAIGGNPSGQTLVLRDIIAQGNLTANCSIPANSPPYTVLVSGTNCGSPWASAAETVGATSGSLTSASGYVRWTKDGTKVDANIVISIANKGSASGGVTIQLPFQSGLTTAVILGRDILTGKSITGTINANTSTMTIFFYDNTYPGANGAALVLNGVYESAS